MELGGSDDLCQLLHVGGLDVHNVEALVLDVEVPEVYAQVITADKRLAVAVDRDAVDVVCMSVGICPTRDGGYNGIVVCEARQLQFTGIPEAGVV